MTYDPEMTWAHDRKVARAKGGGSSMSRRGLLEPMKELVLLNDTCRISNWGSCRISKRSSNEKPEAMVCQKAEALNQTNDSS
ncbi:hypothetical protein STEG23_006603 [Scotinomys teguina]